MVEESASVELNAPVNTIWQLVSTINDWEKWNATIQSAERLTAGGWTPGFRFRQTSERWLSIYTITEVDLGRSASWTGSKAGLTRRMSVELRPLEGGTEVELRQTASGPRALGPLGFFVRRGMRRSLHGWTQGLRKALAEIPTTA